MIHIAAIADETLKQLVEEHRDKAGRAHRIVLREQDEAHYAEVQNVRADIYQELLDRRRASIDLHAALTSKELKGTNDGNESLQVRMRNRAAVLEQVGVHTRAQNQGQASGPQHGPGQTREAHRDRRAG